MKAVILAAGIGSRMPEYTSRMPKALVPVKGISVLERMLDALFSAGITDVLITIGHFADQIQKFVADHKKYESMSIKFSLSPDYATTNYITSLWNAREEILGNDILLFHGDMIFDQHILDSIVASKTSAVCIRDGGDLPEKDFKGRVIDGRVTEIGVDVWGEDAHACMPIYKILAKDMAVWMEGIGKLIKAGDTKCYAEKALNAVSDRIQLVPHVYTTADLCMEVDTAEDIKIAESLLS